MTSDPDDQGTVIVPASPKPVPHDCRPPHLRISTTFYVKWGSAPVAEGMLWRCSCGAFWHAKHERWSEVSDRKAKRIIRRAVRRSHRGGGA